MGSETNENCGLDDRNSFLKQEREAEIPKKDSDDNKKTECNPPSQPAEEHLITESEDFQNKEFSPDVSSFEDTDQGPEEIDPVNRPRNFQNVLSEKPKNQ